MSDKITILYVDDEPINVMLFSNIFKRRYHIVTGESGFEGLEKLATHPEIKAVFSDMKMPGMSGVEFAARAKMKFPDISYFIITGYDVTEEIALALENGTITKHFSKPFDIDAINQAIEEEVVS